MTLKSTNKILLLFLVSFCCLSISAQITNKYTYGDYEFEEIKTVFPSSTVVQGFVNGVALARDKDANSYLVDTLGNKISSEGFRSLNFENRGDFFVVANKQGRKGVINSKGKLVVPYLYRNIITTTWKIEGTQVFQYGLCMVEDSTKRIGFVNTNGKVIIPIVYSNKCNLQWSEGCHVVSLNGLQGVIDTLGEVVIPFQYKRITPMNFGQVLAMNTNDEVLLISRLGVVKKLPYTDFHDIYSDFGGFIDGLAGVKNRLGLWGFINNLGEEVIKCQFDAVYDFSEGIAIVGKDIKIGNYNRNWGCVNLTGKLITPIKYQQIDKFEDGIALVRQFDSRENMLFYNYIDTSGKEINDQKYRGAYRMKYEAARVRNNSWYIDLKQNKDQKRDFCTLEGRDVILKSTGKEIDINQNYCINSLWFSDGFLTISDRDGKDGFIDTNGNVVVPCFYKNAYEFNNNYAWVEKYDDTSWYILKKKKIK